MSKQRTEADPRHPKNDHAGKVLPQAVELEEAVLGAIMLEKSAFARVVDILDSGVFYKPRNQDIFNAFLELYQCEEPIDLLTTIQKLRKQGSIDRVGGAQFIAELTSKVSSAANLEYHCMVINQKYLARTMIEFGRYIVANCYDETTDIIEFMDEAETRLQEIKTYFDGE